MTLTIALSRAAAVAQPQRVCETFRLAPRR